jgi:hypothetical protein
VRRDPASVAIDRCIVERDYQIECIDTLCREICQGRRKLLVEMATGTGKTRTAAAFIKRLFEANAITRVLFLVDRIPLAKQTEDAFAEHLPDYPAYVLRAGRRFQDENGKAALASGLAGGRGFGSKEFHVLRARKSVLPEWIYYFVRREPFRREPSETAWAPRGNSACRPRSFRKR